MSENICNPTTFKGLLAIVRQHPDLVAPAYVRMERFNGGEPHPDAFEASEPVPADQSINPLESTSSPLTAERRRAIIFGIQPSQAQGTDFKLLQRLTQQVMAGAAYLADSPVHDKPLTALHLISRIAGYRGGDYATNVADILRSLDLHILLDLANEQVVRICANEGVDTTIDGLARLKSESLVNAIVFGLGLNLHYLVPRQGPDPWTTHSVLDGGVAIGDLNIAYFAAPVADDGESAFA